MIQLRDYQQRCVDGIRAQFASGNRRVVLQMPTGAGKTFTACSMIDGAARRGKRTLVLVHRIELVKQFSESLSALDIEHGIIARGFSMNRIPVQIGMIQTVANRLNVLARPDLIVTDEAHHATASTYKKIMEHFMNSWSLGLTATPQRTDGRGLDDVFNAIVLGPSMRELIERGALSPYRLFCPPSDLDVSGIRTARGDFEKNELNKRVEKSTITGDSIKHYRRHANGQRFVVFCVSVEHAKHVAENFTAEGIPTVAIDGSMRSAKGGDQVKDALARLESGEITGVASCDLISEGFDLPSIGCAIMLRPTKSIILWLQSVGRALRYVPGKTAIILDHAGNALRHGLPDQEREWSLECTKGKKKKKIDDEPKISIRHCTICFAVYPGGLSQCPHCGAAQIVNSRRIEERDGDLIEITHEIEQKEFWSSGGMRERLQDARTIDDLREMQQARGYKLGWLIGRAEEKLGMSKAQTLRALGYSENFISKRKAAA